MEHDLKSPPWINQDFFTTVIRCHTGDAKSVVSDFLIKPSLAIGEHYPSLMFRADITYSTSSQASNTLSVVIKFPRTNGDENLLSPLFKIEQDMYKGPLSDIKMLLESVGDFSNIQPKLIYQALKPIQVIVMEDLGVKGFVKITQPLEHYQESKMVFERLAKFHASSFFLLNDRKVDFSRFKSSIFHLEDEMIREKWFNESIDTLAEVLDTWEGFGEYATKLKAFKGKYLALGQRLYEPDVNGYSVLSHSDFHVKNLMFKKNGDVAEDCYILDYQISSVASPCADLFYALYNMISDENRRTRRAEIIHDYHNEFSSTLKRLGFIGRIPTLLDLQMDLTKHGFMEVMKCVSFKMFFFADSVVELFGGPDTKQAKVRIYNDQRFKEFITAELPRLVHMGFL